MKLARKRMLEGPKTLPDRYAENAFSHVRTSAHIVDFLSLYYGKAFCDRLLHQMGVHPTYFDNLDNRISLAFLLDLMNEVKKMGFDEDRVDALGHLAPNYLGETEIGDYFAGSKNHEEFYRRFFSITSRFDTNFDYHGTYRDGSMELEVRPSEVLLSALSKQNTENRLDPSQFLWYRKSLFESYPLMANLEMPEIEIVSSLQDGDSADRYLVKYPTPERKLTLARPQSLTGSGLTLA